MKVVSIGKAETEKENRFFEILYDERLADDSFWIPKFMFREVGGVNSRIKAKRLYELLLRLAERYALEITECSAEQKPSEDYMLAEDNGNARTWEGIRTDSYIISRYKDRLLEYGRFNEVTESFLFGAKEGNLEKEAAELLEKMIRREKEYYDIDDAVRPVLIYKSADFCYNILNVFAEQFGAALERRGAKVEYFDPEKQDIQQMKRYIGKHYRAIIGWQTYMFSITLQDGKKYLHDVIYAPKFHFIFDHPIWTKKILTKTPQTVNVLTHDLYYVDFCKRYYGKNAYLFPPAGNLPKEEEKQKKYDISFIGSCGNYQAEVILIHQMDRSVRFLANRFLLELRKRPNETADEVFRRVLSERKGSYTEQEYIEDFFKCRRVIYCVMHYYRMKVMETLLQAGFRVDVFGNSWEYCPLRKYSNLIFHPDLNSEECMEVWQESKISLNVMSWHKGGFTERMINIMLCKSVLITDHTTYLEGRFRHGEDMLIFHLDALEEIPEMIKECLNDSKKREKIVRNGYEKARACHTWDSRAGEFLDEILEKEVCRI